MTYTVINADLKKNKDSIYEIWRKNYPGVLEKKFKWIYENNPAGPVKVWLVRHEESGEYIGTSALFPRRFVIEGKPLIGGIAGDLVVNKDHRSAGPALKLQRAVLSAVQDGTVDFAYGFPNMASEPILKRAGYKVLGERARLVKILKTRPQFSKLPLGRYWGFLFSPFFDLILNFPHLKTHCIHKKYSICNEVKEADERFDFLWEKISSQHMATGERKAQYLNWKFLNSPHGANKIFAISDENRKEMKGYIAYRVRGNVLEIRDLSYQLNKKIFSILLMSFVNYARLLGAYSIEIFLLKNQKLLQDIKRLGFIERKDEHCILIFFSKEILIKYPFLKHRDNWLLLQSDDDM